MITSLANFSVVEMWRSGVDALTPSRYCPNGNPIFEDQPATMSDKKTI